MIIIIIVVVIQLEGKRTVVSVIEVIRLKVIIVELSYLILYSDASLVMLFYDINTCNSIISLFMINSKKYKLCDMINHCFYYYFYYYYYYHTTITYIATAITSIATTYITSSTTILLQLLLMQLLLLYHISIHSEGDNCCGCNHSALSLLTKELGDIEIIFASFYNDTLQKV